MKQQKPILHGRDHACGGADPLPGYCILLQQVKHLEQFITGYGDYTSVQTGEFTYDSGGLPSAVEITNWPRITIPLGDITAARAAGNGLYARWSALAQWVNTITTTTIQHDVHADATVGAVYGPLAAEGWLWDPGVGGTGTTDIQVWMDVESGYMFGDSHVQGGVLNLWWLTADAVTPSSGGSLYPGSYPLVNADVATGAAIDPTKLAHPGGTTTFLRADGAWAATTFQVEY